MRNFIKNTVIALMLIASTSAAQAKEAEVTLRVHHFMTEKANLHALMLVPLAERLAAKSNGRLKLEIYTSMALGGRPGDLYDQAIDGAVDIILTLPGYTAGRFSRAEVFELPFLMEDTVAGSKAFWDLIESDLHATDFEEVKLLAAWVHGPGVIHTLKPITKLEDLRGVELRGPSRLVTDLIGELGGVPVGMPLPRIPESISKGVISGAAVPWEITPSIRLPELVKNHTEFGGDRALYTATLILAMNWDAYDAMPDDLRAILDSETGKVLSELTARISIKADKVAREKARANNIIILDETEVARWIDASQPVYERWIKMADEKGFDGKASIEKAKALIKANK